MREPSIHITKSTFISLSKSLGIKISKKNVDALFSVARGYSLDHRSFFATTKKSRKVASSRTSSSVGDTNLLTDLIYSIRVKMKHIGVVKIKQSDPQWAQAKELTSVLNNFCKNLSLSKRAGYLAFLEIGLKLISQSKKKTNYNYCCSWMLSKVDWITNYYQATLDLKNDDSPESTREVYNLYTNKILQITGIYNSYIENPIEYSNFLYARKLADEVGVPYDIFMEAQFEALAFCNGIPKIEDLGGDKAKQRLIQYNSKYGMVTHRVEQIEHNMWEEFKK